MGVRLVLVVTCLLPFISARDSHSPPHRPGVRVPNFAQYGHRRSTTPERDLHDDDHHDPFLAIAPLKEAEGDSSHRDRKEVIALDRDRGADVHPDHPEAAVRRRLSEPRSLESGGGKTARSLESGGGAARSLESRGGVARSLESGGGGGASLAIAIARQLQQRQAIARNHEMSGGVDYNGNDNDGGDVHASADVQQSPPPCVEIIEIQTLMYLSGCFDTVMLESRSNLTSVLHESCTRCNLTEAWRLAQDMPPSCADDNYGNSGIDSLFPLLFAFCSEDANGAYCASSLAEMLLFDFGSAVDSENDTSSFNTTAVVNGCSGATCADTFWNGWATHQLDDDACPEEAIDMSLLCVQSGGSYCVDTAGGEAFFADADALMSSQSSLQTFCSDPCGQAIATQYSVEYQADDACYDTYTTNIGETLCRTRADGQFCAVLNNAFTSRQGDTISACPSGVPSEWEACDVACANEIGEMMTELGCCARELAATMYGQDEGDAAVTFYATCADVTVPNTCLSARDESDRSPGATGDASPRRTTVHTVTTVCLSIFPLIVVV